MFVNVVCFSQMPGRFAFQETFVFTELRFGHKWNNFHAFHLQNDTPLTTRTKLIGNETFKNE